MAHALAHAFLNGDAREESVVARAAELLGRDWRWLRPVARRYLEFFAAGVPPRKAAVAAFLLADPSFQRAWEKRDLRIVQLVQQRPALASAPKGWNIPVISSLGAMAEWLRLSPTELEWFADPKGMLAKPCDPRLRHYSYRPLAKRSGGTRLIEAPKQHLRAIQRQILTEILEGIPVHPAAHGFVKGRSIRTFAAPHIGRAVVVRMDLKDFFLAFSRPRIQALFRLAGYPEAVADRLGALCTSIAPASILQQCGLGEDARQMYARPHLPQGAPTSPTLANICAWRLDCRLHGLARAAGAVYTRYADDLAFSGDRDFASGADRFATSAAAIVIEEGFHPHFRKTRVMRQGVRQHLAGLVVNRKLNVTRRDYDRLKATLNNCVSDGPESQNRDGHADFRAHLQGRVSFVESVHAARGSKLRSLFEQIRWT